MGYQPKSYRKFLAASVSAVVAVSGVAPIAASAATNVNSFTDVTDTSAYYYDAVKYLTDNGDITGLDSDTFGVGQNLKRQDASVLLSKVLKLDTSNTSSTGFSDVKDSFYFGYINAANKAKVMQGEGNGTFGFGDNLTREEMAKVIVEAFDLQPTDAAVPFTDLDKAQSWATSYIKTLYQNGVTQGVGDNKFDPQGSVTREDFATFVYRAIEATATPAVTSVSAVNGTQLKVTFNQEVDQATAENEANYVLKEEGNSALATDGSAYTAELQQDGKTVIITLTTPIQNTETAEFAFTVENVKLKDSLTDVFPLYTHTVTVHDTEAAGIASVTSYTNSDSASSVTINFTEPVMMPTVKIDGVTKSVSTLSSDGYTATINNLDLDVSKSHTVDIVNLTDLSGNVNANVGKTFNVTKDTSTPSYTVSTKSDNKIILTFNKAMDASTIDTGSVVVKDENLDDLSASDYTVSKVDSKNFVITLLNTNPYISKSSRTFTILSDNTIADSLGNKAAAAQKSVTISKDTTKPALQSVEYVKNSSGVVTNVLFKYNEAVTVNSAAGLQAIDLVDGTTVGLFGTGYSTSVMSDGVTVNVDVTGAASTSAISSGEYRISVPGNFVKDSAFTSNLSGSVTKDVDFGSAVAGTLKVSTVATADRNEYVVTFNSPVTYASATNPANYSINGVVLPSNTAISFDSSTQVTIDLPAGFIASDDTGAVFRAQNVETVSGTRVSANQFVVTVDDNVGPTIVKSKSNINADGTLSLGFSESVIGKATGTLGDFTFNVNGDDVTVAGGNVTIADGSGADAGKYVVTFHTAVSATADANSKYYEYFDVNGNGSYDAANDIVVTSDTVQTNLSAGTFDLGNLADLTVGTLATTTVVKDANQYNGGAAGNALAGNQSVEVK